MARSLSERMQYEELRTLAFGSIAAGYTGIGTSLEYPARITKIQNLTNVTLLFSVGGVLDNDIIPPNGFALLDAKSNDFYLAEGDRIYVKIYDDAPTEGIVAVTSIYGVSE